MSSKSVKLVCIALLTCLAGHGVAATLEVTVSGTGRAPLPDTVVYATPVQPVTVEGLDRVEVIQRNKEFHPFVSVIPVGTTGYFPNRDGIGHHVYSFSPARTFELPLSEKETTVPVVFDQAGIVTIGCNIHDWMVAYIYVVDTPYYAISGDDGKAIIRDLPEQEYTLHVWHPGMIQGPGREQEITIGPDNNTPVKFTIETRPEYFWKPARPVENEEELY